MKATKALDSLLADIEARLQQRLQTIGADEEAAAKKLESAAEARLKARMEEREKQHQRELQLQLRRAVRTAREAQQTWLWAFEQEKMRELEKAICDVLVSQDFDTGRFIGWLESAKARIGESGELVLEVREDWLQQVKKVKVRAQARPILGGAILTDSQSGRQVDGSWDRRLADLGPELWQRWKKDVGEDHQD